MGRQTSIASLLGRHKPQLIAGLLTLSAVDLLQMAIPLVIKRAADAFSAGGPDAADLVRAYALYILAIGLVMAVFRLGWRYLIMGTARRIEQSLRNEFFSHLQKLGVRQISSRKTGDLMARAVSDIETLKFACGLGILVAYDGLFLLIFIMGAMFYLSPAVAAVMCVPFFLMMIFIVKGGRVIERLFRKTQESFSDLTESARRPLHGIKAVKSLRMEGDEFKQFAASSEGYANANIGLAKIWAVYQPAISLCVGVAGAAFLFFGGTRALTGSISLGDFTALLVYLSMLGWPMMAMGWAQDILRRGNSSVKRLNEILKLDPEEEGNDTAARISGTLEVCGVGWAFEPSQNRSENSAQGGRKILDGCSFTAEPGKTVGIFGRTGAGKTALARIICGDLKPSEGSVRIGSADALGTPPAALRRNVIRVDRNPFIFSGTVRDNIGFMTPRPDEEILKAAEICAVKDEIEAFDGRLDAALGERGINLSEGQRQRISLARSVMSEPVILILDDALSSVDLSTESQATRNLRDWARRKNLLLIIISSRTNSAPLMDCVMVLDGGKIAEKGTHSELVSQGGIYAAMYGMQAQ